MTSPQTQASDTQKPSFDISVYAAIVRRRWKFVVAVTVLGFAAAWFLAPKAAPRVETSGPSRYKATNTVLQVAGGGQSGGGGGQMSLDRVKFLSTLGEVPRRVAQRIGYTEDPSLLTSEIDISTDAQVGSIAFSTTQTDPELATQLADAWAAETLSYIATVQADALASQLQDINGQIQRLDAQLAEPEVALRQTLTTRRNTLAQQAASLDQQLKSQPGTPAATGLLTVEPAVAEEALPDKPKSSPTGKIGRPIWLAGATIMAFILGIAAAIVLDRLDKRLHTREDVEDAYDEPILAEIPAPRGQGVATYDPQSAAAESMRMLRTVLLTAGAGRNGKRAVRLEDGHLATATSATGAGIGRSVLVTSAALGDGKTNTALNLALAFAEQQQRVLLVDADLRNADLSNYFGMASASGLSDLAGSTYTDAQTIAATCRATDNPYLFLLPTGTARDRPSLILRGVRNVLETARTIVDVVVVDTTALLVANDTRELLGSADPVVLAVTLGVSTATAAEETRELLERLAAPVRGIALVGAGAAASRRYSKWQAKQSHRAEAAADAATATAAAPAAAPPAATPAPATAPPPAATEQIPSQRS